MRYTIGCLAPAVTMLASPASGQNLVINGTFDAGVGSWLPNDALDRLDWIAGDGAPGSGHGCMEVADALNNGASTGAYTVVQVAQGITYDISGWWSVPSGSAATGACFWGTWFDGSGAFLGYGDQCCGWGEATVPWTELTGCTTTAPAGAASLHLWAQVAMAVSGSQESIARWDDITMTEAPLFADGFEEGHLNNWSGVGP